MKICIKCKNPKELSEFPKRIGSKDGTRNECKKCYSKRTSRWAKKNGYKCQHNYYKNFYSKNLRHHTSPMSEEERKEYRIHARLKSYNLTKKSMIIC